MLEEVETKLQTIEKGVKMRDAKMIASASSYIRSISSQLCANEMAEVAHCITNAAKNYNISSVTPLVALLEQCQTRVVAFLQSHTSKH